MGVFLCPQRTVGVLTDIFLKGYSYLDLPIDKVCVFLGHVDPDSPNCPHRGMRLELSP